MNGSAKDLFLSIETRKSVRSYDMSPLNTSITDKIKEFVQTAAPLTAFAKGIKSMDSGIGFYADILGEGGAKGIFGIKAPHYLTFYSEEKNGYLANAGFIMQQVDLYLSSTGLGSCWLGGSKPVEKRSNGYVFTIAMAFGKPLNNPRRDKSSFVRKTLEEISKGSDKRLEYARLAPSAMNGQPWYFIAVDGKLHIYKKKPNIVTAVFLEKMQNVDMGIALCHLWLAGLKYNMDFTAEIDRGCPEPPKGYQYFATLGK